MKRFFITMAMVYLLSIGVAVIHAATSADGTLVTEAGGSITDTAGVVWTLGAVVPATINADCAPKSCGSVVVSNGSPLNGTAAITLLWFSNKVYQTNASGLWWSWSGTGWTKVASDPRGTNIPPPPVITQAGFTCTPQFQKVTMSSFVPAGATGLTFNVMNQGTSALTITSAISSNPVFSLSGTTFPISIAVGATQTFTVKFIPTAVGKYNGSITFVANVVGSSFAMGVTGVAQ